MAKKNKAKKSESVGNSAEEEVASRDRAVADRIVRKEKELEEQEKARAERSERKKREFADESDEPEEEESEE